MLGVQVVLDRDVYAASGGEIPGKTSTIMPCWSNIHASNDIVSHYPLVSGELEVVPRFSGGAQ